MTTRVAQLTPVGRGAIATVVVRGPQAMRVVSARFFPHAQVDWQRVDVGRILVGRWQPSSDQSFQEGDTPRVKSSEGEELVVCRTASDEIEIHCHGGQAAVAAIVDDLSELGCESIDWQDPQLHHSLTRLQLEAQAELSHATTQRTAMILLDQRQGALDLALQRLAAKVQRKGWVEADQIAADLLRYAPLGQHLTVPWRVVLAGPPNVGKSSLINALVGYQRAVVFDTPGTTRDVVTVGTAMDGWPIELNDTAGIHEATDRLDQIGVRRAVDLAGKADLAILVFDATKPITQADVELRASLSDALVVLNKCDLRHAAPENNSWLQTSALTADGLPQLVSAISDRLVPYVPEPGAPILFRHTQVQLLERVVQAIGSTQLTELEDLLAEWITGQP